jgi:2-oxoglutarate dehydrogenase E2 component (dihydrolipoamide succinyltransferase)
MAVDIRVPPLGESLVEATVGPWLKQAGEAVTAGEPVVELETEKVNLQVSAETSGVLERIAKPTGTTVGIGDVLGTIAATAAPKTAAAGPTSPSAQAAAPTPSARATPAPPVPPAPATEPSSNEAAGAHPVSPVAKQIAAEHGIDLADVAGTGPGGRVTRADVDRYLEQSSDASSQPVSSPDLAGEVAHSPLGVPSGPGEAGRSSGTSASPDTAARLPLESAPLPTETLAAARTERPEERIRMTRRRLTIARRLLEAQQQTASLTTFNEIDMSAVMDLRRRRKEAFQQQHGVGLGFMSFFAKAAIAALKASPEVNAELQDDELVLKKYYDVGIAVDAPGGLVVPVVRNAGRKSFAEIERDIAELAKRARENQLTLDELRGGTFTITNGGVFGSLFSTPIINPPQVAILGMHRIAERPMAVDGQVIVRPMMYVALTYDHRVIDGRTAVQFLVRIKQLIEDPEALLLES